MSSFDHPGPPKNWPQIMVLRKIWRAAARLRDLHQPHFDALRMPIVEFDMLAALGNTEGLRMKDLAEAMITTAPNVTRVCAVMEGRGLVTRKRSAVSDREVIARLTPKGQRLFEEVFAPTVNYASRMFEGVLTIDELKTLAALLDKFLTRSKVP